jgi:hypothetical protein
VCIRELLILHEWKGGRVPRSPLEGCHVPHCTIVLFHLLEISASRRLICSLNTGSSRSSRRPRLSHRVTEFLPLQRMAAMSKALNPYRETASSEDSILPRICRSVRNLEARSTIRSRGADSKRTTKSGSESSERSNAHLKATMVQWGTWHPSWGTWHPSTGAPTQSGRRNRGVRARSVPTLISRQQWCNGERGTHQQEPGTAAAISGCDQRPPSGTATSDRGRSII